MDDKHENPNQSDHHLKLLPALAEDDVAGLNKAERQYGFSWKRRGGVGAFMMLARKWDRIEQRMTAPTAGPNGVGAVSNYDIFGHVEVDQRAEGVIDDIRDLRRYLLLVEAEVTARGMLQDAVHRDNKE